jgi:hemoglobin/transferrin/lactoferrin receptor protein
MKTSSELKHYSLWVMATCFTGALSVLAEPKQPITEVVSSNVVVTALRVPAEESSVPYTTYNLKMKETQLEKSPRSTPEVFQGLPSVMGQKTSYGQGSPYFRGFTGFRNLLLVDGVRLNNSVFRDGPNQYWSTVDSLSVESYDVVMGPSSVLYGSDAIGGTVNASTVAPPSEYQGQPVWAPMLYFRGASAEQSATSRMQLGARLNEQVGFIGGVSLKSYGDLRGGEEVGRQEHTGYDELDFDGRLDVALNKDSQMTFGHQSVSQDDVWRTHKTIYGLTWEGLKAGDEKSRYLDQHRTLDYLTYSADHLNTFADRMKVTVSRQKQQEDESRVKKDSTAEDQGFDVTTWGASLQLESDTALGNWVYGAEYYHDSVDSYLNKYKADGTLSKVGIQGPVADDARYDSVGVYVQDTISSFNDQLDVIPGMRYTAAQADANQVLNPVNNKTMSVEGDWDTVAGSLRLLHPLTQDRRHTIFAGVSQGFRAPNLSDLTRLDTARSNEIETPVSSLEPEYFTSYEAGVKSRFDHFSTTLTYYYTDIDSMIVRAPTGRVIDGLNEVTKKNSGDGYVQGLEWFNTVTVSKNWSGWLSASWMEGEVDAYPTSKDIKQRDYLTRLMPPTAQVGVRAQTDRAKYWVEGLCDAASKADRLSADDQRDTQRIPPGGTPGYAVLGIRVGSQITPALAMSLALENIMDTDYRIHGSGCNEPGRNVVLTGRYTF